MIRRLDSGPLSTTWRARARSFGAHRRPRRRGADPGRRRCGPDRRSSPRVGDRSARTRASDAPMRGYSPAGAITRVTESPTKHGFSLPSTSRVKRVTTSPPAAAHLVDRDDLGAAADPAVDRDRGREADLVPAVVDAEREAGRGDQLFAEAVDQREGEVAVGDRRPEGALGLRPLDVDVDPLVVAGELGEGVDVLLGDGAPLARADRPARAGPAFPRRPVPRWLPSRGD